MPTYYIMPETSGQLQAGGGEEGGGLHISPHQPPRAGCHCYPGSVWPSGSGSLTAGSVQTTG